MSRWSSPDALTTTPNHLGVELFDRSKRQIALTAGGEAFLQRAGEVIHTAQRARASVIDG